jgi:hypothetical protein
VDSVTPPVGQRGSQFTLSLQGSNLDAVHSVLFYSPHLKCSAIRSKSEQELELDILADSDCPLSNIAFRLLGDHGYSEIQTVRITPFSVLVIPRETYLQDQILEVLNVTICNVSKSKAIDRYLVDLSAGQRVAAEVECIRLGHELLDMQIQVIGPDGQLIAQADDSSLFRQDPVLSFTAVEQGRYVIQVHESNYQGGENNFYLLHLGDYSAPGVAYPAGGQFGTTIDVTFRRDDEMEAAVQKVLVPDVHSIGEFQLLNSVGGKVSPTPVPFRITAHKSVLEIEPNQVPSNQLPPGRAPVAFNGILQEQGDVDAFTIEAGPQNPVRIEAFAERIGSPCDTLVRIVDENSKLLASNDDWESHDSRLDFYPPTHGVYTLLVSDKLGKGSRTSVYRLEVSPIEPSVVAFLPRVHRRTQQSQTISIPRGNRALARIGVRRDQLESEIHVEFSNLPSNVWASRATIPNDQFWVPVVFEASADAMQVGSFAEVVAEGRVGDSRIVGGFEQIVDLVAESADRLFTAAQLHQLPVAVTSPVPFRVDLSAPTVPLPVGGTLDIRVHVQRDTDFDGPLRIEFPFLPPWVMGEPNIVIPSGKDFGVYRLVSLPQTSVRDWPLVAVARVDTSSSKSSFSELEGREVSSNLVNLSVAKAPVDGHLGVLAFEQGTTAEVLCTLQPSSDLPESMTAVLEGLPNRVTAQPVEITRLDSHVRFTVHLEEDAPLGEFTGLQCRLTGEYEKQAVSFAVGCQTRMKVFPPGKLFRSESGELLSPLEALRGQALEGTTAEQ